jgi:hypothetical protein
VRKQVILKSAMNDRVVCADRGRPSPGHRGGCLVLANRDNWDDPGSYETHEVEFNHDGTVSFRSQINDDPAITALWSGDPELSGRDNGLLCANRPDQPDNEAGPAERWVPVFVKEATKNNGTVKLENVWALKNIYNGKFMRCPPLEHNPEGRIHAAGDGPNEYELFYSSIPLIASHVGDGSVAGGMDKQQLTAGPGGYGTLVGGQYRHVTSVHDGSDLSQFFYNREESKRRAKISRSAGFLMKRTWADIDGPYWEGQQLRPHWPNGNRVLTPDKYGEQAYVDGCVEYLQFHADLGMCVHIARGTWTSTDSRRMAELWREIIRRAGAHCIGVGEGVNEHDAVTPGTSIEEVTEYRERAYEGVALRCNSAIGGFDVEAQLVNAERLKRYNPGATIIPFHGFRGYGWQNKLERDWNVKYEWHIKLALDGEGVGVGPYVSDTENMEELNGAFFKLRHALMHACGYIPTLMSGSGVISDGNRSQEWGTQVGFNEVCQVRDWIPADAGNFINVFHGGDRWGNNRYFRAIGETRVEHHIEPSTQRGIIIAYGDEAAHIPMHRAFRIDRDEWVEEGHIKGRVIVGQGQ